MTTGDALLRAAVYTACDARDSGDSSSFRSAVAEVVRVHRVSPLVEHAEQLQLAANAREVVEAVVAERTCALLDELRATRRLLIRREAQLIALGELS